jgi:nanoRNase/pAp phosphatase (c-di-AMP/oligoRNAs hydrolase)
LGTLNLITGNLSLTEDVLTLLAQLGWPVSPDMATNLLFGIEVETNGLRSHSVTAEMFDMVAKLMKLGAKRVWQEKPQTVAKKKPASRGRKPAGKRNEVRVK